MEKNHLRSGIGLAYLFSAISAVLLLVFIKLEATQVLSDAVAVLTISLFVSPTMYLPFTVKNPNITLPELYQGGIRQVFSISVIPFSIAVALAMDDLLIQLILRIFGPGHM
jgi:branched-subunit amino acid ABC-type transport system permease component